MCALWGLALFVTDDGPWGLIWVWPGDLLTSRLIAVMLLTIASGAVYALRYADVSRVMLGVIAVYGFGVMLANLWNILANLPVNPLLCCSVRHHVRRLPRNPPSSSIAGEAIHNPSRGFRNHSELTVIRPLVLCPRILTAPAKSADRAQVFSSGGSRGVDRPNSWRSEDGANKSPTHLLSQNLSRFLPILNSFLIRAVRYSGH